MHISCPKFRKMLIKRLAIHCFPCEAMDCQIEDILETVRD